MSRAAISFTLIVSFLVPAGLASQGCSSSKSGKYAPPGSDFNLQMTNLDNETIHVYVSGGEIGTVGPGASVNFKVKVGTRRVEIREKGDSFRQDLGVYTFDDNTLLKLTHDPGNVNNLRVINNDLNTIHVIVGANEEGTVPPNEERYFDVQTGSREVYIRERGHSTADHIGTFNFTSGAVVEITYP